MTHQDRVALVLGGSRGIGAATAKELADLGYQVGVSYKNSREAANEVVEEILAKGGHAIAIHVDLADPASIRGAIDTVTEEFGGLDLLVNNASIGVVKPFDQITDQEADEVFRANVAGIFTATQYAGTKLRPVGSVISIGTCQVKNNPMGGASLYVTAKASISGLTKAFAYEFAERDLRINAIHPGPTDTDMNPANGPYAEVQTQLMPMKSYGQPSDIAKAVAFLASNAANRVTGAELVVDGGWSV